jgi:hypothetical protein
MTAHGGPAGIGRTSFVPPESYWTALARELPKHPVTELRIKSDFRQNAFRASDLPLPRGKAEELLDRVAADGWTVKRIRCECPQPQCECELLAEDLKALTCPDCGFQFGSLDKVVETVVYLRDVTTRQVDWVVAIHGMKTRGEWQEDFSWFFGTTWGRSVPVSVYKYGMIVAGVILSWRRRQLQEELRAKLVKLRDQAEAQGFSGKPDIIAHSFGTWLLGHVLAEEVSRVDKLRVGRLILAGCILRPDFDWKGLKKAGIVDEVLCHYGTKDPIVPLAHYAIRDSGPSGRRGFDGGEVINVVAKGYGHSDLMSVNKCIVGGQHLQRCTGAAGETRHLDHTYREYWRPFLQLPAAELRRLPDRQGPPTGWVPAPRPLQGTLLPFLAMPLLVLLAALIVGLVGSPLWALAPLLGLAAVVCVAGLVLLLLGILSNLAWRRWRRRDRLPADTC